MRATSRTPVHLFVRWSYLLPLKTPRFIVRRGRRLECGFNLQLLQPRCVEQVEAGATTGHTFNLGSLTPGSTIYYLYAQQCGPGPQVFSTPYLSTPVPPPAAGPGIIVTSWSGSVPIPAGDWQRIPITKIVSQTGVWPGNPNEDNSIRNYRCQRTDHRAWIHWHNLARPFGVRPAYARIRNLRTGVIHASTAWNILAGPITGTWTLLVTGTLFTSLDALVAEMRHNETQGLNVIETDAHTTSYFRACHWPTYTC